MPSIQKMELGSGGWKFGVGVGGLGGYGVEGWGFFGGGIVRLGMEIWGLEDPHVSAEKKIL